MKIQLLHTNECHAWQEAEKQLKEALKEANLSLEYEVILVSSPEQAQSLRFSGSPQITIDGQDVDPLAKNAKIFSIQSCRPYFYQGKSYDYPPKEMILEKLNQRR